MDMKENEAKEKDVVNLQDRDYRRHCEKYLMFKHQLENCRKQCRYYERMMKYHYEMCRHLKDGGKMPVMSEDMDDYGMSMGMFPGMNNMYMMPGMDQQSMMVGQGYQNGMMNSPIDFMSPYGFGYN
jgi:hypothetical protein